MITRRNFLVMGGAATTLSACGAGISGPDADPARIAAAVYQHPGPPELILYTMINNRTGSGAHTSLLVNASQRVVFDPAGSVRFNASPEAKDVLYGITPQVKDFYERAHARSTYHVRIQSLPVSAQTAELALQLVQNYGNVPGGACTTATSTILSQLPGLNIKRTLFPNRLADQFATIPGVTDRKLYEDDADDKSIAIAEFEARTAAQAGQ